MDAIKFLTTCKEAGINFYTGVPDSQLKGLCDTLYDLFGVSSPRHIVAANEGGAIALAAGHYLASGEPGLCYMQNSGLGNAVNPLCSLMDNQVYGIPCLLVIGWRGAPGVKDEPQHAKQGEITLQQLEVLDIPYYVLDESVTTEQLSLMFAQIKTYLAAGRVCAFVVRKGGLTADCHPQYDSHASRNVTREQAASLIARMAGERDVFVSTTGKLSRELFEIRETMGMGHEKDFLTVGSMGHASMIALAIALEKPDRRVWCLDGDGAALMHLGALAVIGKKHPSNLIHVVMNNSAHESVGGMPVCEGGLRLDHTARALGYEAVSRSETLTELQAAVTHALDTPSLSFIEVVCSMSSREELGRPTTTPKENRDALMGYLRGGLQA